MTSHMSFFRLPLLVVALVTCLLPALAWAKRSPPPEVAPVIYKNVKYVAVTWGISVGYDQSGGIIEAQDPSTNTKLWAFEVYDVVYDSKLEGDVQDVFITSMTLDGSFLIVENEKGAIYRVELSVPPDSINFVVPLEAPGSIANPQPTTPTAGSTPTTGCSLGHAPPGATAMPVFLLLALLVFSSFLKRRGHHKDGV